jgi:mannosyltransferase OCH1-like enzyme
MNFKQYFENEEIANKIFLSNHKQNFDKIFDVLKSFAIEENLPHPTTYLSHGTNAIIFDTTNPKVIARIVWLNSPMLDRKSCDKVMAQKQFQKSGGVGKIYVHKDNYEDIDDNTHEITYKEKLNTKWQDYIKKEYPNDANNIIKILSNMNASYRYEDLNYLNEFDSLKNLVSAIRLGLPTLDLHADNFALNGKNSVVAIDC